MNRLYHCSRNSQSVCALPQKALFLYLLLLVPACASYGGRSFVQDSVRSTDDANIDSPASSIETFRDGLNRR